MLLKIEHLFIPVYLYILSIYIFIFMYLLSSHVYLLYVPFDIFFYVILSVSLSFTFYLPSSSSSSSPSHVCPPVDLSARPPAIICLSLSVCPISPSLPRMPSYLSISVSLWLSSGVGEEGKGMDGRGDKGGKGGEECRRVSYLRKVKREEWEGNRRKGRTGR